MRLIKHILIGLAVWLQLSTLAQTPVPPTTAWSRDFLRATTAAAAAAKLGASTNMGNASTLNNHTEAELVIDPSQVTGWDAALAAKADFNNSTPTNSSILYVGKFGDDTNYIVGVPIKPMTTIRTIRTVAKAPFQTGAMTVITNGMWMRVFKGTYTNDSIKVADGIVLEGEGKLNTILVSTNATETGSGGPVVTLGSDSIIRNLSISVATNIAQGGIGSDYGGKYSALLTSGAFTNALVENIQVTGGRDIFYLNHTNKCTAVFRNVDFLNGNWDGGVLYGNSNHFIQFLNCNWTVDGSLPVDTAHSYADGFIVEQGRADFIANSMSCLNATTNVWGLVTRGTNATINYIGGTLTIGGAQTNLLWDTSLGGTVRIINTLVTSNGVSWVTNVTSINGSVVP